MGQCNWHVALVGVVAGFMIATLGAAWADSESCPPQCASGKVRLGIAAPTSGALAAFGQQTVKAAEVAVRNLNSTGGLLGTPVELVVADDRCDAGQVVSAATRHVENDKVKFVIGPTCPPAAMAAAPIYAKAEVLQFMPTMTEVGIIWRNPGNFFRIAETDEQAAQQLGTYVAREYKTKKVAFVYIDTFYMRPLIQVLQAAIPLDMQASMRFEALMDVSGANERLAEKLQRNPPDLIYLAVTPDMVVPLVGLIRIRVPKATLMGGQRLLSFRFSRVAAVEGIKVIAPLGSLDDAEYGKAVNLLRQFDVVPDVIALNSYAAVQTWAEAVHRAGSGNHVKVVEMLQSGEFATAVGRVAFDLQGDRRNIPYSIVTWQDGRLRELRTGQ